MGDQVRPVRIGDERVTTGEVIEVHSPYDGGLIGSVPKCGPAEVDRAAARQRALEGFGEGVEPGGREDARQVHDAVAPERLHLGLGHGSRRFARQVVGSHEPTLCLSRAPCAPTGRTQARPRGRAIASGSHRRCRARPVDAVGVRHRPRRGAGHGEEGDPSHAEQLRAHDREYADWRDEQRRKYDAEYVAFRSQRRDHFERSFADWRNQQGPLTAPESEGGETPPEDKV